MESRQTQDDGRVSAQGWADSAGTFERTAWQLPSGVHEFKITGPCQKRIDLLSYFVGKGNPQAAPGKLHFERSFSIHWGLGPNERPYVCLAESLRQRCPVCEWLSRENAKPNANEDVLKGLKPKMRNLWLPFDYAEPDKGVQIWDYSWHGFGKQLKQTVQFSPPETDCKYFADPRYGKSISFGMVEKQTGGAGKFYEAAAIMFFPRPAPYSKKLVESLPCLDDLLIIKSYDELYEIFHQTAAANGEPVAVDHSPAVSIQPGRRPAAMGGEADDWGDTGTQPAPATQPAAAPQTARPPLQPAGDDWGDTGTVPAAQAAAPQQQRPAPATQAPPPTAAPAADDWDDPQPLQQRPSQPAARPAPAQQAADEWNNPPPAQPPTRQPPAAAPAPAPAPGGDDWD